MPCSHRFAWRRRNRIKPRLPADLLDRVEAEQEPARLKAVSLRKFLGVAKVERAGDRRLQLQALVKRAGC
jgi:hypothetical protein